MGLFRLPGLFLGLALAVWLTLTGLRWACATSYPVCLVRSRSMSPALEKGDLLLLYNGTDARLDVGTVVVFKLPNGTDPIVHRIEEIRADDHGQVYLVTKGDHNVANDQLLYDKAGVIGVTRDLVWGVVSARVPRIGKIRLLLHDHLH